MSDLHFWNGLNGALGFESRTETEIVGRSGIRHKFKSLAINEKSKRVLVVSNALDPKMAALVHADSAANLADYKLLTIRPETFSLAKFASSITEFTGQQRIDLNVTLKSFETWFKEHPLQEKINSPVEFLRALKSNQWSGLGIILPFLSASIRSELGVLEQATMVFREFARLDWYSIKGTGDGLFDLDFFTKQDSQNLDQELGLCGMPLYNLDEDDWEEFQSGTDFDALRSSLKRIGVAQYFEPPSDHATLAFVDRGLNKQMEIAEAVLKLPEVGHPFAEDEFLSGPVSIIDKIQELKNLGYVAEGQFGIEVTENGRSIRSEVKFKPREGAISKILNIMKINVNVNPNDFR